MKHRWLFTFLIFVFSGSLAFLGCSNSDNNNEDTAKLANELLPLLRPIKLTNCELDRVGSVNDGGYLVCKDMIGKAAKPVESGYSIGIEGRDDFGCALSKDFNIPVYQYDPFNTTVPACPGGKTQFFPIGLAGKNFTDENGRKFETLEKIVSDRGDIGKVLFLQMDIEGAEYETFAATPDDTLKQFQQISLEVHDLGGSPKKARILLEKLDKLFYIVWVHANNCCCTAAPYILPSNTIEIHYVNKNIGTPEQPLALAQTPNPLNSPNLPNQRDCPFTSNMFSN